LPFKVGDKVWFIVDNEVHEGTLTKCNITIINKDDTQICYNVLYYNHIHCGVVAKGVASNKLFKTKKELLESL
jgi:peptide methionine sulfoxide reductase MsrB